RVRQWASWIGMGVMGMLLLTTVVSGQPLIRQKPPRPPIDQPGSGTAAGYSSVRIIENGDFRRIINVARDCIKDGDWPQAVEALQAVLNEKKDYYVKVSETGADGKEEFSRWTSVKFEANNLLGSMPAEGLERYEFSYGKDAKDQLDEAKSKGDRELLAEVAQRYCHTRAGIEAN